MIYWQKTMIYMARSRKITQFVHKSRLLNYFSKGFVGGKNEADVLETADNLKSLNIDTSIFYLGEYVEERSVVQKTVESLLDIIEKIENTDIHISVDPTQVGLLMDFKFCMDNMIRLSEAIKSRRERYNDYLMIDMEDSSVTDNTLKIYLNLVDKDLPCGITLQAYLKRTENDLEKIFKGQGRRRVRLVKGAFAEKEGAYTVRNDIDKNFLNLAEKMLDQSNLKDGFYPVFATHDHRMVDKINKYAQDKGIGKDQYEFEMLFGVRGDFQRKLVKNGNKLRLYTPYGTDWWPYSIRRIGENPRNLIFVMRSLFGKVYQGKY